MADVGIAPTAKYVLAMPSGQIIDQIDGGIVTYMRKVWFTTDKRTTEAGGNAQWLSTQDYADIFLHYNRDEWFRTYGTGTYPLGAVDWRSQRHSRTPNQKVHHVRVGKGSPPPPSYQHTEQGIGYLPDRTALWAVSPALPNTPFPILPFGGGLFFATDVSLYLRIMFQPFTAGSMVVEGRNNTSGNITIQIVPFGGGGLQAITNVPPGFFAVPFSLSPADLVVINNQSFGRTCNITVTNDPFIEVTDAYFTWRYS